MTSHITGRSWVKSMISQVCAVCDVAPDEYAKRERANRAHLECAVEKRSQRALLEVLRGAYTTGSRWSGDHRRQLLIDITLEYQALEIERHRMASNARED